MISYGLAHGDRLRALGDRARQLRLALRLPQTELAQRAGVSVPTVKRFEHSGTATLENALRLATVLNADAAFDTLFAPPEHRSIDEALAKRKSSQLRRVRKPK